MANSLELGCDCLGEIYYFDVAGHNRHGQPVTLHNAICMHEEDYGLLWKHFDWRTGYTETRCSRWLVVSFIATVGNYKYGPYWYLYQDGSIQFEVKLTGVIPNGAVPPGEELKWGTLVARPVYGPIRQHFFNVRLDMMVDGPDNSVYEVNTVADPSGPENPHNNAFHIEATAFESESEAQRIVNPLSARYWTIVNPSVRNRLGQPVGYKLLPGENVLPFAREGASVLRRAGFTTKHLWVTPYDPRERCAAGDYPNQHAGGWPTCVYSGQPFHHEHGRGGLVHVRCAPRGQTRGLASHAHNHDWPFAQASRILRSESGTRRSARNLLS